MKLTKVILLTFFAISCGSSGKSDPDAEATPQPDAGEGEGADLASDGPLLSPDSFTIDAESRPEAGSYLGLPEKCGGNMVGTWLIEKIDLPGMIEALVGYSEKDSLDACAPLFSNTGKGLAVFRPDGTFSISASMDMTFSMTSACVTKSYRYDCQEVKNCAPDNAGRCNCVGMPDGDKTVGYSLQGRYAAGHGTLMLVVPQPNDGTTIPTSTLFTRTPVWNRSVFSTYCEKDGTIALAVPGLPGGVDYFQGISRTVLYGVRKPRAEGDAPETPPFSEGPDSPKPAVAPKTIGCPSDTSSPWCKSTPAGKWSLSAVSIHLDLQKNVIREVREVYPDGECVSSIGFAAKGSVEFGPEEGDSSFASDETVTMGVRYQGTCLEAKAQTCESVQAALKLQTEKLDREAYSCEIQSGDCWCERVQRSGVVSATYYAEDAGPAARYYAVNTAVDAGIDGDYISGFCVDAKSLWIELELEIDGSSGPSVLKAVPVE